MELFILIYMHPCTICLCTTTTELLVFNWMCRLRVLIMLNIVYLVCHSKSPTLGFWSKKVNVEISVFYSRFISNYAKLGCLLW